MIRRMFRHRQKPSPLILLLKTMRKDEEFICTEKSFAGIEERMKAFIAAVPDKRFRSWEWNGICHVKRIV